MLEAAWSELCECSLPRCRPCHGCRVSGTCIIPLDLQQILDGQRLGRAVVLGDIVQHINGFLVPSLTDQVSGTLTKSEKDEACEESSQGEGSHGVHEIPPPHVVLFVALSCWCILRA